MVATLPAKSMERALPQLPSFYLLGGPLRSAFTASYTRRVDIQNCRAFEALLIWLIVKGGHYFTAEIDYDATA
ncbi:hypothetical protein AS189_09740 [Arthrobacter alpinus]|uniref:Uncharacterized protein n=1 Tax=Arthrobacter alpinus TaxID=656366 RepID=A0A0S2LZV7_9MICC|nr:hypothetical protein AS189_09740 [Arthrobacter alpinus]